MRRPGQYAMKPKEIFNYPLGNIENYSVSTRIGRGKYSNVFAGHQIDTKLPVVVKVLKPVRLEKINREISILELLKGGPNISQLLDIVSDADSGSISLILNYSENHDVKSLFGKMTAKDISIYIYGVLKAIKYAHSKGIMHRDIKPGNIMWNQETKEVSLIDWGLAEFYQPSQDYQVRVATKHYKGPELLLSNQKYTPSLDIWCLGCSLAGLLFHKLPFFKGRDNNDQIEKMCYYFGGKDMVAYVEKYNLELPPQTIKNISNLPKREWSEFVTDSNRDVCTPEALDLLSKMLVIDHAARPSAEELMKHPFFDQIRNDY